MHRLILMRHAKTERAAASGLDRDRALTPRGLADAALMGAVLVDKGLRPDLAIVSPRPRSNDVGWAPIMRQRLALAVPADHPFAVRDEIAMTEARDESFVAMGPTFGMRRILEELCAEADFRPQITFEATELGTVAGFVAAGLGVAVIPVEDNPQLPAGLTLLPLTGDRSSRDVGLIWHRDRAMTPVARRFRDYVTEWAAERR